MGIYGKHVTEKKVKPGTYKHVKAGVLKAIGVATVSGNVGQPLAAQGAPSLMTALAETSTAGTPACPYWHKGFSWFGFAMLILAVECWGIRLGITWLVLF